MKVLHLIFSEQVAGAEKYLLELLPGLKNEGIECHLICVTTKKHDRFDAFCNELNEKGVPTTLLAVNKFSFWFVSGKINRYLKNNGIKYVHSHLLKSDFLAVLVKKFFDKKIFLLSTKHGYQEKYLTRYPVLKGKIVYDTYYFIARFLAKNIDQHVTISAALSKLYYDLKLTSEPIKYIHHGIDISYVAGDAPAADRQPSTPQLIIVGRLEEIKGHRYLFEAMPAVIKQFPAVKLLILGNGTLKDQLKKNAKDLGIADNINFLGFVPEPYAYMTGSDIIVLPSFFESFGLVYIEAFALKVPIVAFDVPAYNEIVTNNETGLLVPVYDSKALAEKIIYLLMDPSERKRLAANGYAKYTGYYNTARMIKETAAWYRSVLPGQ